jgi:hypothetical protein
MEDATNESVLVGVGGGRGPDPTSSSARSHHRHSRKQASASFSQFCPKQLMGSRDPARFRPIVGKSQILTSDFIPFGFGFHLLTAENLCAFFEQKINMSSFANSGEITCNYWPGRGLMVTPLTV